MGRIWSSLESQKDGMHLRQRRSLSKVSHWPDINMNVTSLFGVTVHKDFFALVEVRFEYSCTDSRAKE